MFPIDIIPEDPWRKERGRESAGEKTETGTETERETEREREQERERERERESERALRLAVSRQSSLSLGRRGRGLCLLRVMCLDVVECLECLGCLCFYMCTIDYSCIQQFRKSACGSRACFPSIGVVVAGSSMSPDCMSNCQQQDGRRGASVEKPTSPPCMTSSKCWMPLVTSGLSSVAYLAPIASGCQSEFVSC